MTASEKNISTEHQPKGSARNLSDTLDRQEERVAPGQRQWADDSAEQPEEAPPEPGNPADDEKRTGPDAEPAAPGEPGA
jgi:hypothetical protein